MSVNCTFFPSWVKGSDAPEECKMRDRRKSKRNSLFCSKSNGNSLFCSRHHRLAEMPSAPAAFTQQTNLIGLFELAHTPAAQPMVFSHELI